MAEMMFDHSPTQSVARTSPPTSFELAPRRLTSDSSQQPNELCGSRPEPAPRLRSKSVRSCVTPPRFLSSNAAATPSAPAHTVLLHLAPGTSVRVPYRVPTIPPYMAAQLVHGPATVQLVQTNPLASLTGASTQPLPVPDAPAGQRLEQLVDESGNLGHILVAPAPSRAHAPETHPAPLQMCGAPAPLPASSSAAGAAPQATTQTQTANQQPLFIPLLYAGQNPNAGEATSSSGPATAELHASASGARDERTATQLATSASAQTDEEELMCAASVKCDLHAGVHEEISIEKDIEWEKEKAKQTSVKAQPHAAGVGKGALDEASDGCGGEILEGNAKDATAETADERVIEFMSRFPSASASAAVVVAASSADAEQRDAAPLDDAEKHSRADNSALDRSHSFTCAGSRAERSSAALETAGEQLGPADDDLLHGTHHYAPRGRPHGHYSRFRPAFSVRRYPVAFAGGSPRFRASSSSFQNARPMRRPLAPFRGATHWRASARSLERPAFTLADALTLEQRTTYLDDRRSSLDARAAPRNAGDAEHSAGAAPEMHVDGGVGEHEFLLEQHAHLHQHPRQLHHHHHLLPDPEEASAAAFHWAHTASQRAAEVPPRLRPWKAKQQQQQQRGYASKTPRPRASPSVSLMNTARVTPEPSSVEMAVMASLEQMRASGLSVQDLLYNGYSLVAVNQPAPARCPQLIAPIVAGRPISPASSTYMDPRGAAALMTSMSNGFLHQQPQLALQLAPIAPSQGAPRAPFQLVLRALPPCDASGSLYVPDALHALSPVQLANSVAASAIRSPSSPPTVQSPPRVAPVAAGGAHLPVGSLIKPVDGYPGVAAPAAYGQAAVQYGYPPDRAMCVASSPTPAEVELETRRLRRRLELIKRFLARIVAPRIRQVTTRSAVVCIEMPAIGQQATCSSSLKNNSKQQQLSGEQEASGATAEAPALSDKCGAPADAPAPGTSAATGGSGGSSSRACMEAAAAEAAAEDECALVVSSAELEQVRFQLLLADSSLERPNKSVYVGEATEITLNDLRPATLYFLRVRAQLEGIDGEVSAPARFETLAALPGPPRSLRLVARADRTVTLEWSAPAEQCGPLAPLRAYALEYAELRERRPASAASSASAASGTKERRRKTNGEREREKEKEREKATLSDASVISPASSTAGAASAAPAAAAAASQQLLWRQLQIALPDELPPTLKTLPDDAALAMPLNGNGNDASAAAAASETNGNASAPPAGAPLLIDDSSPSAGAAPSRTPNCYQTVSCRVTELRPATCYLFRVAAQNRLGRGLFCEVPLECWTCSGPPTRPDAPRASRIESRRATLEWTVRAEQDDEFAVELCGPQADEAEHSSGQSSDGSRNSTSDWRQVYRGACGTLELENLQRNTPYKVRVCALNELGRSTWSAALAFSTRPERPEPPTGLRLKSAPSATAFAVEWAPPSDDGGETLAEYVVELGCCRVLPPAAASSSPAAGAGVHKVSVGSARAGVRSSKASPLAIAHQHQHAAPAPAPVPERSPESAVQFEQISRGQGLECACSNLLPNTEYLVRVRAKSRVGLLSDPCDALSARTATDLPGRCGMLRQVGRARQTSVQIKWCRPEYDGYGPPAGAPISCFSFFYKSADGSTSACSTPRTPHSPRAFFQAASDRLVDYDVELANPPSSSPSVAVAAAAATPSAPAAEGENNQQQQQQRSTRVVYHGPYDECVINGLTPGLMYEVRVRAANKTGLGEWSDWVVFRTMESRPQVAPAPPTLLAISTQGHKGAPSFVHVDWDEIDAALGGSREPLDYVLEARHQKLRLDVPAATGEQNAAPPLGVVCATQFRQLYRGRDGEFRLEQLLPHALYEFRVAAANSLGVGPFTETVALLSPADRPYAVKHLSAAALSCDTMLVEWEPLAEEEMNGAPLTSYMLEVVDSSTRPSAAPGETRTIELCDTHSTSYKMSDLQPNVVYYVRVRCANRLGASDYSSTVHCRTLAPPPAAPPADLRLDAQYTTSLKLSWMPVLLPTATASASRSVSRRSRTESQQGACFKRSTPTIEDEVFEVEDAPPDVLFYTLELADAAYALPPQPPPPPPAVSNGADEAVAAAVAPASAAAAAGAQGCFEFDSDWRVVYSGEECAARITRLQPGHAYTFRVCVGNRAGHSPWSAPVTFTTALQPPAQIKGLVIRERLFTNEARGCCIVDWSSSAGRARAETMTLRYELQLAVRRIPASAEAITGISFSSEAAAEAAASSVASPAGGGGGVGGSGGPVFATIYKGSDPRVRLLGLEPLGAVFTVRVRALRLAPCPESFTGSQELAGPHTDVELALPQAASASLPASFYSSPLLPSFRVRVTRTAGASCTVANSAAEAGSTSTSGWSIEASPVDLSAERPSADVQSTATHGSAAPAIAPAAVAHPVPERSGAEQHVAPRVARAAPHSAFSANITCSSAVQQTITSAPSAVATRPASAGARAEGRAHPGRKMRPLRAMQEHFLDVLCRLFGLNVEIESDVQPAAPQQPPGRSSAAAQSATALALSSRSSTLAHTHDQTSSTTAATTASTAAARSSRLSAVAESFALDPQQRRLLLLVSTLTALFALLLSFLLTSFVEF